MNRRSFLAFLPAPFVARWIPASTPKPQPPLHFYTGGDGFDITAIDVYARDLDKVFARVPDLFEREGPFFQTIK